MTFDEYRKHDATALAGLIKSKQITASELVEVAISRIEQVNDSVNAVILKLYDEARQTARQPLPDSPLAGVPFLMKDLGIEWKGARYTMGCRAYADNVSKEDSVVGSKVRKAGLMVLGKTNTPEFGVTPFTEPLLHGATKNPWNLNHTSGGSSGGSAAAVAAGFVPLATANDGGGSIRIPASCCGLFGLKPTRGRVSLGDAYGEAWFGATVEGCVSRSVRDSAAYLDWVSGAAPGDPYIIQKPEQPFSQAIKMPSGKLRIGFTLQHPLNHPVDEDNADGMKATVHLLQDLGHEVEEVALPYPKELLTEMLFMLVCAETATDVEYIELNTGKKATTSNVEPSNYLLWKLGRAYSAKDFTLARRKWNDVARAMGRFHEKYDLLLTPTLGRKPVTIGELKNKAWEETGLKIFNALGISQILRFTGLVDQIADRIYSYIPYTPLANITGQPAMSVPLHWSKNGLPVGMMFTGRISDEAILFRLAAQLEEAKPWFHKVALTD